MTCRVNIKTKIGMLFSALTLCVNPIFTANAAPLNVDWKSNGPSLIGKNGGIAALDSSGQLTNPIFADHSKLGSFLSIKSYAGVEANSPVHTMFTGPDSASPWDIPGDYVGAGIPWGTVEMLGGHHADDKAFRWTYGQPVAGGLQAVVDGVYMNGMSAGQGSGVTAGTQLGLLNYGELDAVARETRTGGSPPKFAASSAITDPDGNTHTVTFTATGATFSPALPAYWARFLVKGMNIITNENALAPDSLWQNNWLMPWLGNTNSTGTFVRAPHTWWGTITGWHTNSDGTVDSVTLDGGWILPGQKYYSKGDSPTNKIPGTDTLDGSAPSIDNYYTSVTDSNGTLQPAIFFGVYNKAFPSYELCQLNGHGGSRGDINSPNGDMYDQTHQCSREWDMWNDSTVDYQNSMQGLAIDFNSASKLTNDSFGVFISGGNKLPSAFIATNMLDNAPTYTGLTGSLINAQFAPVSIGSNVGDVVNAEHFSFANRPGGNYTVGLSLVQIRDHVLDSTPNFSTEKTYTSIHWKYHENVSGSTPWDSNTTGGDITFNPTGFYGGIGLGAGGTVAAPKYNEIISADGKTYFPSPAITFTDASDNWVGDITYNEANKVFYWNVPVEWTKSLYLDSASSGLTVYNKTTTGSLSVATTASFNTVTISGDATFSGNSIFSKDIVETASTGVASAGSSITDATTISSHYTDVTNTTATSGMKLPTNVVGKAFVVFNRGNADLMIYPDAATSQIESYGAGQPFTLSVNSVVTFVCVGANQWRIM